MVIALISLTCMFLGTLFGFYLRTRLPGNHLEAEARDVIKLGAGLVATQVALVLGLLVSSAKSSFDSMNSGLSECSAKMILLDQLLDRYGSETKDIREDMRRSLASVIERVWSKGKSVAIDLKEVESATGWEIVNDKIRNLGPQNESQRLLKDQLMENAGDLARLRLLLIEGTYKTDPAVFLVVLVFWCSALFSLFGLLTTGNKTVKMVMLVCALAVASGIFVIRDMSQPLNGMIKVSSASLDNAAYHLDQHSEKLNNQQ